MKKLNIMALGLILLIAFSVFAGCSVKKYNAEMYSKSKDWVKTSFLEDKKVRGAYYPNPDYVEGSDNPTEKYYYDEVSPKNRTFIIDNQETYDMIFNENALAVDFEKEIVYLFIFADVSPSRYYYIDRISLEEDKVVIYYKLEKKYPPVGDATAPFQRCLIVKMKKLNLSNVEFIEQR